ncbi:MAG: hypothetical protein KAR06_04930 [Deltaproteobacteria bacterium]|nr:hypothetical protein [Deltaproteobacteria bacterium]
MATAEEIRLNELAPKDELAYLIREATVSVERDLALEDLGWVNLSGTTGEVITDAARITNLKVSRLYAVLDPFGKQAIRLWTDYTFGSGMTWSAEDDNARKALEAFWNSPENNAVLSARGQRKSSDKLNIDGDIFFALFLGPNGEVRIRWIDPLEITEIITNPGDRENIRYYRREWSDVLGQHRAIYRDWTNIKDDPAQDISGKVIKKTEDALIYYLNVNTTSQRGNPLLLPALLWMKYYNKFLSSRIGIMLALAKFAWRTKVKGGQTAVDSIKAKTHDQEIAAGSTILENMGADTTPIKVETGAANAYSDGRQIKLMIFSSVGISEQYFSDISTGNLATAKTVELPMQKMFQSYQAVWADAYKDINNIVLKHNNIPEDKWYVDLDFPPIAPRDVTQIADALVKILNVMPGFADSDDVKQIALLTLGVNDPTEALDALEEAVQNNPTVALIRAVRQIKESIKKEK